MYPSASEPLQLMLLRVYERTDNITDLLPHSCFSHCNYHMGILTDSLQVQDAFNNPVFSPSFGLD